MDWSKSIIHRIGFYRFVTFVFCYLFFSVTLGYLIKNNDEATESQIIQNKETLTPDIVHKFSIILYQLKMKVNFTINNLEIKRFEKNPFLDGLFR